MSFTLARIGGSYGGTLKGARIEGIWSQSGHEVRLTFEQGSAAMRAMGDWSTAPRVFMSSGGRMKTIQTFLHPDGRRRVDIYHKDDGTFGFEEQQYHPQEQAWCPLTAHRSIPVLDSEEAARKEAKSRIDWLQRIST